MKNTWIGIALLAIGGVSAVTAACPFCAAPSRTLGEEMNAADIVIIATLVKSGKPAEGVEGPGNQRGESTFAVKSVLKGEQHLGGAKRLDTFHFGDAKPGTSFLITGMLLPETKWTTPIPLSDRSEEYVSTLLTLPEKGPARLAFFQNYLEDKDTLMAQDSYDEFAKSPYADVQAMKDSLDHEKLVGWVKNLEIAQGRRRLYLTLLGVCGQPADVPMLEGMMKAKDRRARAGLDALIGCYLVLKGPEGLTLVEDLFIGNKNAEYSDTYGAIMAVRVLGEETNTIPKEKLVRSLRLMLERPDLADLVIADLARWEDWDSLDRLVKLFKDADGGSNFVRVPVISYLEAASRQKGEVGKRAQAAIDELTLIDPESVKRAKAYAAFGSLAAPKAAAQKEPQGQAKDPAASEAAPAEKTPKIEQTPNESPKDSNGSGQPDKSAAAPRGANRVEPAVEVNAVVASATHRPVAAADVDLDVTFSGRRLMLFALFGMLGLLAVRVFLSRVGAGSTT